MTETLCDSGAVKLKAGANASTTITGSGAMITQLINQAESSANGLAKIDLVAGYSGYSDDKKKILEDYTSAKAALGVINYDMSGFTSRQEAVQMVNWNWAIMKENEKLIEDKEWSQTFLGAT